MYTLVLRHMYGEQTITWNQFSPSTKWVFFCGSSMYLYPLSHPAVTQGTFCGGDYSTAAMFFLSALIMN